LSRVAALGIAVLISFAQPLSGEQAASPWDAPPEAKQLQNPVKTDGRTVERGKRLFEQQCIPCHGASGAGDGAMAKKLGYKPADLTLEKMTRLADGEVFWKISKGKAPMPTFEQKLSERDRWDLVSYVRTLVKALQ
jgi:mono/diheme cytochrome c family protein